MGDIINTINDWVSIVNLDNVLNEDNKNLTIIGKYLLDNNISLSDFKIITNLHNLAIKNLVTLGSDVLVSELILACRHLGIGYTEELESNYHLYNKKDNLLQYYCLVKCVNKRELVSILEIKYLELDDFLKDIKVSDRQLSKICKLLNIKLDKGIDLNLNAYNLFKGGDNKLLDLALTKNKKFKNTNTFKKTSNVSSKKKFEVTKEQKGNLEVKDDYVVVKVNNTKKEGDNIDIDAVVNLANKAIKDMLQIVDNFNSDLQELIGIKNTNTKLEEINTNVKGLELGKGIHTTKGIVINSKHYNAFYCIRLSKNLMLDTVSKDTGISVKELKNLETYGGTHNKVSSKKLRVYYGIDKDVYLDGVSDKLRLFGYLLNEYNIHITEYSKDVGKSDTVLYKGKYKCEEEHELTKVLIKYLKDKGNKDVQEKIERYYSLTGLNRVK